MYVAGMSDVPAKHAAAAVHGERYSFIIATGRTFLGYWGSQRRFYFLNNGKFCKKRRMEASTHPKNDFQVRKR